MNKMLKIILIVVGVIFGLLFLAFIALVVVFFLKGISEKKNSPLTDAHLTEYVYSEGGGMTGGGYSQKIKVYDETHALISSNGKAWHYSTPHVTENLVDIQILSDIEEVFKKYDMQEWDNKTFTDEIVYDGPSYGYRFVFDYANRVSFSSQIYPEKYRTKLKEIDTVIAKYEDTKVPMPKLLLPEMDDDELMKYQASLLNNGEVTLEIFRYKEGILDYRVTNGTGETYKIVSADYKICKEGSQEPIDENRNGYYEQEIPPRYDTEECTLAEIWFEPGTYTLYVGENDELELNFVIE